MLRAVLGSALLMLSGAAHTAWQEASSAHFVVYSNDSTERVKTFTTMLERYDKALHVLRGVPDTPVSPSSRVTVYVVYDAEDVRKLMRREGANAAGFYVPRSLGSIAVVPRQDYATGAATDLTAQEILLHEYAHHFMYSTWGKAAFPTWFVEGFAEFNATARFKPDGSVVFGAPPLYRQEGLFDDKSIPIKRLLTANVFSLPEGDRNAFYGRAWLLTDYLSFDPERQHQLNDYIAAINRGEEPTAAAAVFGDVAKLDDKLRQYIDADKWMGATLHPADLPIGPVTVRALSPAEAAIMPARIRSAANIDPKYNQDVLKDARRVAAKYPDDAAVQNELAEAEFDVGHFTESEAASKRALAIDPKSIHALMYQGRARMVAANQAHVTDPATWEGIRHWFAEANHLEPAYAWPMELFYRSYFQAQSQPTENAKTELIYAHSLAPFDASLGLLTATLYLREGKADMAREVLKPIAYNPHGGPMVTLGARMLAALDGDGGVRAALRIRNGGGADGGQ